MDRRTATALGTVAAAVVLALLSWVVTKGDDGSSSSPSSSGPSVAATESPAGATPDGGATIRASQLPVQAQELLTLIDRGGPFPSGNRDGVVFRNDEGLLPAHADGYYHEYTARTPGESDRGARRIIAGSGGELYWTADHYQSFQRIIRS